MNIRLFLVAVCAACALSGCAALDALDFGSPKVHALPYQENALSCLALGREYQSQGRFELARETFLHGLAMSRNEDMRHRLAEEIEATDRLILSSR
ncbi:hypothetical protein [Desulfocurvus sp. DL9XJH121]